MGYRVPEQAPLDDDLVTALAQSGGSTSVTRDERLFEPFGVRCLDPWDRPETT